MKIKKRGGIVTKGNIKCLPLLSGYHGIPKSMIPKDKGIVINRNGQEYGESDLVWIFGIIERTKLLKTRFGG